MDSNGVKGSPLILLSELRNYLSSNRELQKKVKIFFNDGSSKKISSLQKHVCNLGLNFEKNIKYSCDSFQNVFATTSAARSSKSIACFFFIDQFGITELNHSIFQDLIKSPITDWLTFMSSSAARRFLGHPSLQSIPQAQYGRWQDAHRDLAAAYRNLAPEDYFILPFSIKKNANIYGLLFGSSHPLGADKFVSACWKIDPTAGEANYQIDGDHRELCLRLSLLPATKITNFQRTVEQELLKGTITTNRELYLFTLRSGCLPLHARKILMQMRDSGTLLKVPPLSYDSFARKRIEKFEFKK
jgi:three-Cys-motif partner protein